MVHIKGGEAPTFTLPGLTVDDGGARLGPTSPPSDHQFVDEERQRHLVELVGQELGGEPTREVHEMVGGNGAGHGDLHTYASGRGRLTQQPNPIGTLCSRWRPVSRSFE